MNRPSRIIIASLLLAVMLVPLLGSISHAQQPQLNVSTQYMKYNIVRIEVTGVSSNDKPLAFITLLDEDGNAIASDIPILLMHVSGDKWVAYLALNDTFKEGIFQGTKITKLYQNNTEVEIPSEIVLYNVSALAYKVGLLVEPKATIFNKSTTSVATVDKVEVNGKEVSIVDVGPIVNAIKNPDDAVEVEVKVVTASNTLTKSIILYPSPMQQVSSAGPYVIAPEKPLELNISDPTITLLNPDNPVAPLVANRIAVNVASNVTNIAYMLDNPAIKAILLETGASTPNVKVKITLTTDTENTTISNNLAVSLQLQDTSSNAVNLPNGATLFAVVKLNITDLNTNESMIRYAYLTLKSGQSTTSTTLSCNNCNLTKVLCTRVVVLPANYEVSINGNTETSYMPVIKAKIHSDGVLTIYPRLVGREDAPSYNDIQGIARSNALVVIQLKETSIESYTVYADGKSEEVSAAFQGKVRLQVGEVSVEPASLSIGGTVEAKIIDIDANNPVLKIITINPVTGDAKIVGEIGTKLVTGTSDTWAAKLAIKLSDNGSTYFDVDNGVLYLGGDMIADGGSLVRFVYIDMYPTADLVRKAVVQVTVPAASIMAPEQASTTQTIYLNISSSAFNMMPDKTELLKVSVGNNGVITLSYLGDNVNAPGTPVASITIKLDGEPLSQTTIKNLIENIVYLIETGKDTGLYQLPLDLLKLPHSGVLTIEYLDLLTGQRTTKNIAVGVFPGKLYFAMAGEKVTSIPIALVPGIDTSGHNVSITFIVVVKDLDANTNPDNYDVVNVALRLVWVAGGAGSKDLVNMALRETDVNTGVFVGYVKITYYGCTFCQQPWYEAKIYYYDFSNGKWVEVDDEPVDKLVGGYIEAEYHDAKPQQTVRARLLFAKTATAELEIEPATIQNLTQTVTLRLSDKDLDIYPGAGNDFPPAFTTLILVYDNNRVLVNLGQLLGNYYNSINETEPGVFEVKMPAYELLHNIAQLLGVNGDLYGLVGEGFELVYVDPASAMSAPGSLESDTASADITVASHTAELALSATKVSPYGTIVVNITDPDIAPIPELEARGIQAPCYSIITNNGNCLNCLRVLRLVNSNIEIAIINVDEATGTVTTQVTLPTGDPFITNELLTLAEPVEPGSDTYQFVINLAALYNQVVNGKTVARILAENGIPISDRLLIVYVDGAGSNGEPQVIDKYVDVVAETGKLAVPDTVVVGKPVTIRVEDFDANKNTQSYDTVTIYITDAVGQKRTIRLVETKPDSGVFEAQIIFVDNLLEALGGGNKIYAPPGTQVQIVYPDQINASGVPENIIKTIKVVSKPPVEYPVTIEPQVAVQDVVSGQKLTTIPPGTTTAALVVPLMLNASVSQAYVIATIYNEQGVAVGVALATAYNLPAGKEVEVAVPLPALPAGTYKVKILVLEDITTLKALTETPIEITITVG